MWGGTAKNYVDKPDYASPSDAIPPPNWALRYPDGYTDQTGFPDLANDEHFQVWMRIAAFPTFRKLWARNDNDVMTQGRYRVVVNMSELKRRFHGSELIGDRLPRQAVLWHQVGRHIYRLVDWRKAALPRMGIHRRCYPVCRLGYRWSIEAFDQAAKARRYEL